MDVATFDYDAVLAAFFSSTLFLLGYTLIAPWWHSSIGRAVAFLDAGLVVTLAPSALHQILGFTLQDLFYAWYYGSSLYLVAAITLWRLVVIVRIQRKAVARRPVDTPQDDPGWQPPGAPGEASTMGD